MNPSTINHSNEQQMLDYYFLVAKMAHAVSLVCQTTMELLGNDEECLQTVDHGAGVRDVLATMKVVPSMFKVLTNFTIEEFNELSASVCSVIASYARSTGEIIKKGGRPPKLTPQQRLLNFILYLKHDNSTIFDAHQWNWAKSSVCDDAVFIASCIEHACEDEIRWPNPEERRRAASQVCDLPGCIGFIDGTLCKIRRPHSDPNHKKWYNGRKSMYCFNNVVIVDHQGLFIYVDPGYPESFHDVNCPRHSKISQEWRRYFTINDDYQEYLLGDPGYMGEVVFIMRRVDRREIPADAEEELSAIDAFNKMHAGYRIQVEWGIGGMKRKFKRLMKGFDASKDKFPLMFKAAAILTNFIHRRRRDFHSQIDEDQIGNGWQGAF
jgi:hypothetical protein